MDVLKEMDDIGLLVPFVEAMFSLKTEVVRDDPQIGHIIPGVLYRAMEEGELTAESVAREILYLPKWERRLVLWRVGELLKGR